MTWTARRSGRRALPSGDWLAICWLATSLLVLGSCADRPSGDVPVPEHEGVVKTAAHVRAERRLYDGAPPMIPHPSFGSACIACHHREGVAVPGVGFAPPSPHGEEAIAGSLQRCQQCHLFQTAAPPFVANTFSGLRQDLRRGRRLYDGAPPVIPHQVLMRANCLACHSGAAAREDIRTSHPERSNCRQCHVEQTTVGHFPTDG